MSQLNSKIRVSNSRRSTFDLSHHQVTTADFGQLIPICYRDMLPNDDFTVTPQIFCRLAPLAVPVYGSIKCKVSHHFVPYRILYEYWDSFIAQSPSNHTTPPYFTVSAMRTIMETDPQFKAEGTVDRGTYIKLLSNLGLNPELFNTHLGDNQRIAAFPFLAYYRIWLDYYMNSDLHDHSQLSEAFKQITRDGGNLSAYVDMFMQYRNRCFKKDYFTTAKLQPQEGDPSKVGVDVATTDLNPALTSASGEFIRMTNSSSSTSGNVYKGSTNTSVPSSATSKIGQFTVEALRAATSLQRYLERNNFVGSKIVDRILAHFGISPSAERMDMAELIGTSSFDIAIQDVTSHNSITNSTDPDKYDTLGLGMQAGKGVGNYTRNVDSFHYHAKEHGIFMTLMSLEPDTSYYQGISKFWQKGVTGEPLDYFTPEFENLGYQEILNKELYIPDLETGELYQSYDPNGVFGYTPRYSEYKFQYGVLGSDFVGMTTAQNSGALMDSWHLFRKLRFDENNPLALNDNFVTLNNFNNDFDRVFQLTSNEFDHFYFNIRVDVKAIRNMVGFAEPSIDATNMLGDGKTITLPYGGSRL